MADKGADKFSRQGTVHPSYQTRGRFIRLIGTITMADNGTSHPSYWHYHHVEITQNSQMNLLSFQWELNRSEYPCYKLYTRIDENLV